MIRFLCFFLAASIAAPAALAQWVPATGKIRQTREILAPGKPPDIQVREGSYYRRSDGSVLQEWTKIDGDEGKATGNLTDHLAEKTYQLGFSSRVAIERQIPPGKALRRPPVPPARPANLRRTIIAGVPCAILPATIQKSAAEPRVPAGETCLSDEFSLMLRNDLTVQMPNGTTVRTLFEFLEIELHKEPDSQLFDLKARGFRVLSESASPRS